MTSSLQLRPNSSSQPSRWGARASLCGAPSPRRSRPRAKLANRSLTSPVTCPVLTPGDAERFLLQARTASPTVASTTMAFPAQDAFHRRVLPEEPATHPRLCRRAMSFRPAFTPARSRDPGLDLSGGAGSSPAARRPATCRSPTSAIETTREHDRRSPRTLPTPREVALAWSFFLQVALRSRRVAASGSAQPAERFTGQGPHEAFASSRHLRRRSLAFRSFAPTRSTRTLHVARS